MQGDLWYNIIPKNRIKREGSIYLRGEEIFMDFKFGLGKKQGRRGFTLAELLIVVAIIAVLVAVSIPIFSSQLKKARLAVDHSAIRDAYTLVQIANTTESVEIDGVLYTYSELKSRYTGSDGVFVLNNDCSSLLEITDIHSLTYPENSFFLKENGCDESNVHYCNTCAEIGKNIATASLPWNHYKNNPVFMHYSRLDNIIYLGLG